MRAFISTYKQTYVASYERMNKTVENNLNAVKKNLARLKSQGATEALNAVYDALSSVLEDAAIATVSNAEDKKNQQEAKAHKNAKILIKRMGLPMKKKLLEKMMQVSRLPIILISKKKSLKRWLSCRVS